AICPSTASSPTRTSTRSLHDALPISDLLEKLARPVQARVQALARPEGIELGALAVPLPQEPAKRPSQRVVQPTFHLHCYAVRLLDRKSTRLNSCHDQTSYAVFCLKKQ